MAGAVIGGVMLAIAVILLYGRYHKVPIRHYLDTLAIGLLVALMFGRVGCFLNGCCYGRPTDLPWGVRFPQGLPPTLVAVHPTQLYEAAALFVFAWLLVVWHDRGLARREVVGRYLLLAGSLRFLIEFIRVNVPVLALFTMAQLFAAAAIVIGAFVVLSARRWPQAE